MRSYQRGHTPAQHLTRAPAWGLIAAPKPPLGEQKLKADTLIAKKYLHSSYQRNRESHFEDTFRVADWGRKRYRASATRAPQRSRSASAAVARTRPFDNDNEHDE